MDNMNSVGQAVAQDSEVFVVGSWRRVAKSVRRNSPRRYHYEVSFVDNISGFVVHSDKGKKYRVFVDSNNNGVRDAGDELISKGKIEKGFRGRRPGRLLSPAEDGVVTAQRFDPSMDAMMGFNLLGFEHVSFLDVDANMTIHDHGHAYNHADSMMSMM